MWSAGQYWLKWSVSQFSLKWPVSYGEMLSLHSQRDSDFLMTIFDDNLWWQIVLTIFDDNFWWQFLMTIFDDHFDDNFWWQFLMTILMTIFDDTDYNTDNWEPGFMTIFVTLQLIVTLDSIRNSCNVSIIRRYQWGSWAIYMPPFSLSTWGSLDCNSNPDALLLCTGWYTKPSRSLKESPLIFPFHDPQ